MIRILKLVSQVADTDATVLIQGDSGTGKELVARSLHDNSRRRCHPFVPINCGALPVNLLESELFGHVRGSFTGAIKDNPGWLARADGGTVFLDEVCEMTPALQVKLLRVLQTGDYSPVGNTRNLRCDIRFVAATNKDPQEMVCQTSFREDLYYRLNVIDLEMPVLRERKSDIPLLLQHFIRLHGPRYGKNKLRLSKDAEALLLAYDYPGNVRELENIVQRCVALTEDELVRPHDLPSHIHGLEGATSPGHPLSAFRVAKKRVVEKFEQEYITDCLKATRGNISRAASTAGINVKNFHVKMKKYGIASHPFKHPLE